MSSCPLSGGLWFIFQTCLCLLFGTLHIWSKKPLWSSTELWRFSCGVLSGRDPPCIFWRANSIPLVTIQTCFLFFLSFFAFEKEINNLSWLWLTQHGFGFAHKTSVKHVYCFQFYVLLQAAKKVGSDSTGTKGKMLNIECQLQEGNMENTLKRSSQETAAVYNLI